MAPTKTRKKHMKLTREEIYKDYISQDKVDRIEYKTKKGEERLSPIEETAVFVVGDKRLVFVAGKHTVGDSPFTKFLSKLLKKEKPGLLLVEDRRDTDLKSRVIELQRKDRDIWTEVDWLLNWSDENKVPVKGMDADSSKELDPIIEHYGVNEGMKIAIFQTVMLDFGNPYITDPRRKFAPEECYDMAVSADEDRFLNSRYKEYFMGLKDSEEYRDLSLKEFIKKVTEEVARKYVREGDILEILGDRGVKAPYPFVKKYEINKILTLWDSERDLTMINTCIEGLRENDTVVAVAGSGHIQMLRKHLRRALEEEFGEVMEQRGWR